MSPETPLHRRKVGGIATGRGGSSQHPGLPTISPGEVSGSTRSSRLSGNHHGTPTSATTSHNDPTGTMPSAPFSSPTQPGKQKVLVRKVRKVQVKKVRNKDQDSPSNKPKSRNDTQPVTTSSFGSEELAWPETPSHDMSSPAKKAWKAFAIGEEDMGDLMANTENLALEFDDHHEEEEDMEHEQYDDYDEEFQEDEYPPNEEEFTGADYDEDHDDFYEYVDDGLEEEEDDQDQEYDEGETVEEEDVPPPAPAQKLTRLYEHARNCEWEDVLRECQENPRDAKCVCEKDGTTALHLAVMSRSNPMTNEGGGHSNYKPAPRLVIEALLVACPEAAIIRCAIKKYTPLTYACLVVDKAYDMDNASDLIVTILRHAPHSSYVFTDDGFSALDVHILSYSRLHRQKEEVYSGGRTSTVVLLTLLQEKPFLADARTYRNKIRGPVELLYRCNMDEFKEATENGASRDATMTGGGRMGSMASTLSDWWAWKWTLLLLKYAASNEGETGTAFSAVQAAARLVGCPIPILSLAIGMFPKQVEARDPRNDLYNMPLHEVASWRCDSEIISGDPFVIRRKAKAIELLLEEYPEAVRTTNNMGETPLQLAIESCTPWDGGLELLVKACPKALKFPRKLRPVSDVNKTALSTALPSDIDSVACGEDDSDDDEDADQPYSRQVRAVEGMYPFLVAAVLSRVPDGKRKDPSFLFADQSPEEHAKNLAKKDLQSIRSIYGLLRAKPDVLNRYRNDVRKQTR